MKLINYLLSESAKGWKWPNNVVKAVAMEGGRDVSFYFDYACPPSLSETLISPHPFTSTEVVTSQQYEAALAASKPEWDGEGLPPVGCECQYETNGYGIKMVRVECITKDGIAFTWIGGDEGFSGLDCINISQSYRFRPIRSEADKKRNEAVEAMIKHKDDPTDVTENRYHAIFDAIAAGKIPHIRID